MVTKPKKKKKKKRKVTKFKTITFKLTARQKKSLDKNSKARRLTPLKLIKRSIEHYLKLLEETPVPVHVNSRQLDLFAEFESTDIALKKPEEAEAISA